MGPTFRRFLTCTARPTLVPEQPSRGQWQRGPRVSGPCGDGPTHCWNSWPGAPALLGDSVYSGTPLTPGPEPPNPCPTGALRPRNQLPARFSHTPSLPRCSRWQAWGRVQQTVTIQRWRLTQWPRLPRHLSLRWRAAHCTAFQARSACLCWHIPGPILGPDGGSPGGGKGRIVGLVSTRNLAHPRLRKEELLGQWLRPWAVGSCVGSEAAHPGLRPARAVPGLHPELGVPRTSWGHLADFGHPVPSQFHF